MLAVFLILALMVSLCPPGMAEEAQPEVFTCGDYEDVVLEDGTAEISILTDPLRMTA